MTDPDAPFDRSLVPPGLRALGIGGLEALAAEYETPLFVYDEDELRRRCAEYLAAFGPDRVAYASKAFLCTAMVRLVAEEELHLDVATGGELHVALTAEFPAARIILHGNNKSEAELVMALDAGVGRIVVDSFDELDRLEALASGRDEVPRVLVRVTPGVEAHTHVFIETGTEDSKFGFSVADGTALAAARRVAASPSLVLVGLHCHIGSQVYVLESYRRAAEIVVGLAADVQAATGDAVEELNLGGGLGVRYLADDPHRDVAGYAATLVDALGEACAAAGLAPPPRLMVEPGRSIAAPAALTLYRVGTVKTVRGGERTYVAVDGGMSDNPRPVLYGAGYEAYLPRCIGADRPLPAAVVGKHCEQGDVLVADARLPADVAPGDLLAMPVTGAYGHAMASNYNKVPRPAVVFVRGGDARIVVERESFDDLVRLDRP